MDETASVWSSGVARIVARVLAGAASVAVVVEFRIAVELISELVSLAGEEEFTTLGKSERDPVRLE